MAGPDLGNKTAQMCYVPDKVCAMTTENWLFKEPLNKLVIQNKLDCLPSQSASSSDNFIVRRRSQRDDEWPQGGLRGHNRRHWGLGAYIPSVRVAYLTEKA